MAALELRPAVAGRIAVLLDDFEVNLAAARPIGHPRLRVQRRLHAGPKDRQRYRSHDFLPRGHGGHRAIRVP